MKRQSLRISRRCRVVTTLCGRGRSTIDGRADTIDAHREIETIEIRIGSTGGKASTVIESIGIESIVTVRRVVTVRGSVREITIGIGTATAVTARGRCVGRALVTTRSSRSHPRLKTTD